MRATTLIPTSAEVLHASGQALQDGHDMVDCGPVNSNSAALHVLSQGCSEMRAEALAARALLQRIRDGAKVSKAEIEAALKGGAK